MFRIFAILVASSHALHIPVGATYGASVHVPIVGRQDVTLIAKRHQTAHLDIEGIVSCSGDVRYIMQRNGTFEFELDDTLAEFMRKYRCRILNGWYDEGSDVAHVTIHLQLLRFQKAVTLVRLDNEDDLWATCNNKIRRARDRILARRTD